MDLHLLNLTLKVHPCPIPLNSISPTNTTAMRGTVISIPIPSPQSCLPVSDKEASPYVIRLIDGSIHRVSPDLMEQLVTTSSPTTNRIKFPSWLGNNQKVMYLKDGIYVKRLMEWSLDETSWRFSHRQKNGTELFGILLPNFCHEFQKYIDDGTILPGWHSGKKFTNAGSTRHVSARTLISSTPPGSILKALHPSHPEKSIWFESYQEEYDGLISNDTFDIISEAEYQCLRQLHGVCVIPSMCIFVIKHTNGVPTRAKSHIVVLGNLEQWSWTKADCFSPVISIPMIRLLTAMAVQRGRTLKQADSFKQPYRLTSIPLSNPH